MTRTVVITGASAGIGRALALEFARRGWRLGLASRRLATLESLRDEIVANAGAEPSVVVNKVLEGKGNYGYNAANDTYGDMIEMGILDPTKVTRTALQNAASVAGLMLTTECMVAEAPKEEAPAMPGGGGGMGGMGGMGMDM